MALPGVTALRTPDLKPRIGTEVLADKAALLSGQHADALRELLEQRGVLVFPRIGLSDDEQIAFTQTLVPSRPTARAKALQRHPGHHRQRPGRLPQGIAVLAYRR